MKRMIMAADRGDGLIGIWWYTDDNQVIGLSEPVDSGKLDGQYIQFSSGNHMSRWRDVIKDFIPSELQESVLSKGFKSLYRGRVIYDTLTSCYVITCSEELKNNSQFRKDIVDYFQLSQCNRQFMGLEHYRYKRELTGNPTLDEYYLD